MKHDPLQLGQTVPTEPKHGLEAFLAEFACVECPAELVEAQALVVADLIARGLNQNQVPRAPFAVSEPNKAFTLPSVETLNRHDDTLTCTQSLQDRDIEQLTRTRLDLVRRYTTCKQGVDARKRKHSATFLDGAFGEPVWLRRRSADDQQQAARRVAQTIRGAEGARPH